MRTGTSERNDLSEVEIVLSVVPTKVVLKTNSGLIEKPDLLKRGFNEEEYEDDYHGGAFLAYPPDWKQELLSYQERRWRGIEAVIDAELLAQPGNALDFGCGTGGLAGLLDEKGFQTLGVELSERSVELARRNFPHIDFEVATIEALESRGVKFDLITMSHVLEHCREDSATLRRLAGLLTPGGMIYVEVPLASYEALLMRPGWMFQNDHYREYSEKALRIACERETGLRVAAWKSCMDFEPQEPFQCVGLVAD